MGNSIYSCDGCFPNPSYEYHIEHTNFILTDHENDSHDLIEKSDPLLKYKIVNLIYTDSYGELFLCYSSVTNKHFSLYKIKINKEIADDYILNYHFEKSFTYLQTKHPYTLNLIEIYEFDNCYWFINNYNYNLQSLSKKLSICGSLGQNFCGKIMYQLLSAVNSFEKRKEFHGMLNPHNILIGSEFSDFIIKINHFGIIKVFGAEKYIKNNLCYLAPEIINGGMFTIESDIWSCGIIMYFILTEELPFSASADDELKAEILNGELKFSHKIWDKVPVEAKGLLIKMLEKEPEKRITAKDALDNIWLSKYNSKYKTFLD